LFPEVAKTFFKERNENNLQPESLDLEHVVDHDLANKINNRCDLLPKDFSICLHGENYEISVRGSGQQNSSERNLYLTVDGVPEEVLIQHDSDSFQEQPSQGQDNTENNASQNSSAAKGEQPSNSKKKLKTASKPGDVTSAMPGVVVDIKVKQDESVESGDVLLVIEAMKMETEIQAQTSGKISAIHVKQGDSVVPNQVLMEIV